VRIEEIIGSAISRAGVIHVRSALNPFLWSFVWTVAFLLATYALRDDPPTRYICLGLAALPLLVTMAIGVFFAVKHPDRLQSEEYRLQQRALQMRYKHGANAEIVSVPKETARIESLPGGFGNGDNL
jgi:hypothetical protein